MSKEFFKFLLVGGINTVLTYGIYLLLFQAIPYFTAYSMAYVAGMIISYILNTLVVFKTVFSLRKMITFPLVYAVQYAANCGGLVLFVKLCKIDPAIAPALIIVLSVPITFILSKLILKTL